MTFRDFTPPEPLIVCVASAVATVRLLLPHSLPMPSAGLGPADRAATEVLLPCGLLTLGSGACPGLLRPEPFSITTHSCARHPPACMHTCTVRLTGLTITIHGMVVDGPVDVDLTPYAPRFEDCVSVSV